MFVMITKHALELNEVTKGLVEILPGDDPVADDKFGGASVSVKGYLPNGAMVHVKLDRSEAADLYALLKRSNLADGIRRSAEFLSRKVTRCSTSLG
jgi:hypothetical protein